MCVVSRARNLSLAKSIVRRSGGSLRATDAMSRADHARRGDESHRLTCLPRRSGEASPFRFLSSGLSGFLVRAAACLTDSAAAPGLHAFAVPVMAQTSVTLPSSTMCLASDAIFASFKIDAAPLRTGVNCLPYGLPMLGHGATRMEAVKHATEDRTVGKAGPGSGRQARRLQGRVWKVGRCIGKSFKAGKSAMTGSCATGRLSTIR